jgi:putative membrane protein
MDTTRHLFLLLMASIPTVLYQVFHWHWLALPWLPIALIGTAVAFVVGFKNNAAYDRLWEARKIWGGIVNTSRTWGIMVKDYVSNTHAKEKLSEHELRAIHLELYQRHFAWLTALRYQLREPKPWEAIYKIHNQEYKNKYLTVEEHETKLADTIKQYLQAHEYDLVMSKTNKVAQILALQSENLKKLLDKGLIEDFRHMEMERVLVELYNQQGASERIKKLPIPPTLCQPEPLVYLYLRNAYPLWDATRVSKTRQHIRLANNSFLGTFRVDIYDNGKNRRIVRKPF